MTRLGDPEKGFAQAIIADPDNDELRLVYADWLEEQGQSERAEFIRIGCRLAHLSDEDTTVFDLRERELALVERHKQEWFSIRTRLAHWDWQRGFIETVSVTFGQFLEVADKLFAEHPVQELEISNISDWKVIAACPHLERLRFLTLQRSGAISPTDARRLAKAPWRDEIAHIVLYANFNNQTRQILEAAFGNRIELI